MGKYRISVVTPYHNVKHNMFDSCIKSMKSQTIGFENIEWIITVHNCSPEYKNYAFEQLGSYENVVLEVLNNDCHTAASPRNKGLELATSDYVAFLDGDDKFRPDALERLVGYFNKTKAQVIVFRREYELESPDMVAISETVPYDTTREIIMPDVKFGMENRLYNDFPFFITSRAFDLNFLRENSINFDENIIIGEDIFFNLQTIHLADRICFLPQFIGYIYYINSSSAIGGEKTDEEILNIVDGLQKVIERALDYGLFADLIIIANAFVLSRYLSSPNVKMETRIKVKDIYEPYLKMTSPIPTGRFGEPFNTMMNILPHEILLNIRRFENTKGDTALNGYEVLAGILKENTDSNYGKRYHFTDILSPRGYQSQVPLSDLRAYQPMIDVEKSIGDTMLYSSNKPKWYIRMLNDMLTPVSAKQAEKYADVFHKQLSGRNILVWTEDETPIVPTNSGIYISSFSGISVTEYRRKYLVTLDEYKRQLVIPYEVFCNMEDVNRQNAKSLMDRTYLKLLFAAADKDVDQIVLFGSSYELGSLKDDLFANLREFADDIEAGKHIGSRDFHESYIRTIARMLHKDPERAAQLRAIADKVENFTLKDVWKNLSEITSICINPDESQLSEFDGIPLKCSVIANEMGVIAKVTENNGIYMLLRDEIFYEFIPEQASENDRPVLAEDLRVGDRVTPVATTDAGVYRVPLRFMIEITGIESGNILFSLC